MNAEVRWNAPVPVSPPVTHHLVRVNGGPPQRVDMPATSMPYTITAGGSYTADVTAENAIGSSPSASATLIVGLPGAPVNVQFAVL